MTYRTLAAAVAALLATLCVGGPAVAQTFTRITNVAEPSRSIHIETGQVEANTAAPGWWSAQWEVVPYEGPISAVYSGQMLGHLKNRWTGKYLAVLDPRNIPFQTKLGMVDAPGSVLETKYASNTVWLIERPDRSRSLFHLVYPDALGGGKKYYLGTRRDQFGMSASPVTDPTANWVMDSYALATLIAKADADRRQAEADDQKQRQQWASEARVRQQEAHSAKTAPQYDPDDLSGEPKQPGQSAQSAAAQISSGPNLSLIVGGGGFYGGNKAAQTTPKTTPIPKYEVAIDFCHSDLSDTGTANELIVTLSGVDGVAGTQRIQGTGNCSILGAPVSADAKLTFESYLDVSNITVETTGGDGLFIDEVEIWRNGDKTAWHGRDNGRGWCVSTDANDHIGGWEAAVSGCSRSISLSNRTN